MALLRLDHVCKKYDNGVEAVNDFNLKIDEGEFIIIVGPSGCGKTTTLRMIAGLEDISKGEIYIADKLVNDVESKHRGVSMVFQNYALYPHMNVYENIAFALKIRKLDEQSIDEKVHYAAKVLDIEDLLMRKPSELSGGQKQRVAIGRAIVRDPKLFLMDEPLSNLDAKLRVQMRNELARLHKELNNTIVYVTHDQTEAMTLGSRIVVMNEGVIQQVDSPKNLYEKPNNIFVASFIGSPQMNFLNAKVILEDQVKLQVEDDIFVLNERQASLLKERDYLNKEIVLGIRPEALYSHEYKLKDFKNKLNVKLNVYELTGAEAYLYFEYAKTNMIARVNSKFEANVGAEVTLYLDEDAFHLFDKTSGKVIK